MDTARQYLTAAGIKVTAVSGNRQVVDATGSVATLSSIFHTGISIFRDGTRTFFADVGPVPIPAPLLSSVQAVVYEAGPRHVHQPERRDRLHPAHPTA
ncbi:MAG TPA: protease pro-enzyme activation domain-containing protein [Pseudonocardiaceae bacterium]|nr:protease pro-enzyme activation domain-containing protein [Pseudonocardiaceae bacterium]